jgi:hypothetical protein
MPGRPAREVGRTDHRGPVKTDAATCEGRSMIWRLSNRADKEALPIADRHYNRQKVGSPQFVPPGRCVVLIATGALWVTSWPFAEYVKHDWPGAWVNSCFRKECEGDASDFIRDAVSATRFFWEPPAFGLITFIDPIHVEPRKIRNRSTWGHSYFKAGFKHIGYTKAGLWTFQMLPEDMPAVKAPIGAQMLMEITS